MGARSAVRTGSTAGRLESTVEAGRAAGDAGDGRAAGAGRAGRARRAAETGSVGGAGSAGDLECAVGASWVPNCTVRLTKDVSGGSTS